MSAPVYSTQLYVNPALVSNEGFTVPADYRAVLRDVDIFFSSNASASGFVLFGPEGAIFWYAEVPELTAASAQWRGRQVFNPGDIISFEATTNAVSVMASGYLLTLP